MLCRKNFAKRTGSTLDDLSEVVDTVEDGAMVSFLIADWPRNMKNAQQTAEKSSETFTKNVRNGSNGRPARPETEIIK